MRFGTKERAGIEELKRLSASALEVIDKICLRDEIAYMPGSKYGQTEFRCGIQQAGKLIRELIALKIDWEEVERREQELKRKKEETEEYGV